MAANDFMLTKLHELPWPVLRNICLFLDEDGLRELLDAPQLQEMMLDILCRDKIQILPAEQQVDVRWNKEDITLSDGSITDFFETYPNFNPRVYSVCAQGDYINDVSTSLHERLNRADAIEIWSHEEERGEAPVEMTVHDLRLLLSYRKITSVDLDQDLVHVHDRELASLVPQITSLQSLRLEIEQETKLPFLSRLEHLTSLELFLDNENADIDDVFENDSTCRMLYRVFSQESFLHGLCTDNLYFPPLLKTLRLKGLSLESVEVSLLPSTLEVLDLSYNEIDSFPYQTNYVWPVNLKTLDLHSNKISDLSLIHLLRVQWPPCLQTLDLLGNCFTSLENLRDVPDSISHLMLTGTLWSLQVSHNRDGGPFFRFPNSIRTFTLESRESFSDDDDDASYYGGFKGRMKFPPTLEHLSLINVSETDCLPSLIFPSSLKTLRLEKSGIRDLNSYNSLPGDAKEVNWAQLTNLRELNLNDNQISTLAHWYLPKLLRVLGLMGNQIASLESELTPLFNAQCRDLTRNILTIDLEHNEIKTIDNNAHLPENLCELNLSANLLSQFVFTESFASHCNLFRLNLQRNSISKLSVHNHQKRYASQLRYLDLYSLTHKIPSDEYDAVFQQLGLKPTLIFDQTWDSLCECGYHRKPLYDEAWDPRFQCGTFLFTH